MMLEVALPPELSTPERSPTLLAEVGAEQGVEVTVRAARSDVL